MPQEIHQGTLKRPLRKESLKESPQGTFKETLQDYLKEFPTGKEINRI